MNKALFITPDPYKTPGITFHKPIVFNGGHRGEKIWIKKFVNGILKYTFKAVYFIPKEIIEGYEKKRIRWLIKQ